MSLLKKLEDSKKLAEIVDIETKKGMNMNRDTYSEIKVQLQKNCR